MIKLVKAVVMDKENKILLLKRAAKCKFFPSQWDFPGGKVEKVETSSQALVREVKEETNLDITFPREFKEHYYTEHGQALHFNVVYSNSHSGEIKISEDHSEFKWFTQDELDEMLKNKELAPIVQLALFVGKNP